MNSRSWLSEQILVLFDQNTNRRHSTSRLSWWKQGWEDRRREQNVECAQSWLESRENCQNWIDQRITVFCSHFEGGEQMQSDDGRKHIDNWLAEDWRHWATHISVGWKGVRRSVKHNSVAAAAALKQFVRHWRSISQWSGVLKSTLLQSLFLSLSCCTRLTDTDWPVCHGSHREWVSSQCVCVQKTSSVLPQHWWCPRLPQQCLMPLPQLVAWTGSSVVVVVVVVEQEEEEAQLKLKSSKERKRG